MRELAEHHDVPTQELHYLYSLLGPKPPASTWQVHEVWYTMACCSLRSSFSLSKALGYTCYLDVKTSSFSMWEISE